MTDLCRTFANLAASAWETLKDGFRLKLSIGETTITDLLLLELSRYHSDTIRVIKFNPVREGQLGADWAWWFLGGNRSFGLRVQAKLFDCGSMSYPGLPRNVGRSKRRQVDVLIEEAKKHAFRRKRFPLYPIYCFYNYWPDSDNDPVWNCQSFPPRRSARGCAIADAVAVRRLIDNNATDLRSIAPRCYPWSCLVCCPGGGDTGGPLPDRVHAFCELLAGTESDVPTVRNGIPDYIPALLQQTSLVESPLGFDRFNLNGIVVVQTKPDRS